MCKDHRENVQIIYKFGLSEFLKSLLKPFRFMHLWEETMISK